MGSTWQYTLAYRPQANSHVERVNGEILRHIRVLLTYEVELVEFPRGNLVDTDGD